jgi:DNA-binding XRE family transcriptional regulator
MNKVATFTSPSGDEMVVLPAEDYRHLVEAAEMAEDVAIYDEIKQKLAAGEEELVPAEYVYRMLDGENPVAVWREYRGLTAKALAEAAGITQAYLSQIETGKRDGTVGTMKKIAEALKVTIDDLV